MVGRLKLLLGSRIHLASQASRRAHARRRKRESEMSQSKYKLATGFPVIALTYSEYVHLQFARQRQPGDWIEWPSMGRDTRQMLSHLLDVEKVRFIGQRNDGAIRIIVKEPGNAFPGAGARRPDRLTGRELHLVRGLCRRSECCT